MHPRGPRSLHQALDAGVPPSLTTIGLKLPCPWPLPPPLWRAPSGRGPSAAVRLSKPMNGLDLQHQALIEADASPLPSTAAPHLNRLKIAVGRAATSSSLHQPLTSMGLRLRLEGRLPPPLCIRPSMPAADPRLLGSRRRYLRGGGKRAMCSGYPTCCKKCSNLGMQQRAVKI